MIFVINVFRGHSWRLNTFITKIIKMIEIEILAQDRVGQVACINFKLTHFHSIVIKCKKLILMVILTNLTNEKNLLKLQLVKISSQNCQKRNWAIIAEILIKSGDGNTWIFTACRQYNTYSHIIFYLIINIT